VARKPRGKARPLIGVLISLTRDVREGPHGSVYPRTKVLTRSLREYRNFGKDCLQTQWLLSSHALWVCMPQEAALLARGCHPFSATANHPQHTGPCSVRRRRSNYGRPTPSGWYTFLLAPMICPAASSFVLHRNRIRTEALSARLARSAGLRTIIFPSTPLERYIFSPSPPPRVRSPLGFSVRAPGWICGQLGGAAAHPVSAALRSQKRPNEDDDADTTHSRRRPGTTPVRVCVRS